MTLIDDLVLSGRVHDLSKLVFRRILEGERFLSRSTRTSVRLLDEAASVRVARGPRLLASSSAGLGLVMLRRCAVFLVFSAGSFAGPLFATPFQVTIDTSPIAGSAGSLAFDFLDLDPSFNAVQIAGFLSDGVLGSTITMGGPISGALPGSVRIEDTDGAFFNELLQEITFGSAITFSVELTAFNSGAFLPDSFSFFLLDSTGLVPLFTTSDPTGADALFAIDVDGSTSGQLSAFAPTGLAPGATSEVMWRVQPVPEPSTSLLLVVGLLAVGACARFKRANCRSERVSGKV